MSHRRVAIVPRTAPLLPRIGEQVFGSDDGPIDRHPLTVTVRTSTVPASVPTRLEPYMVPITGPEGQLLSWRLDLGAMFNAGTRSARDLPREVDRWRSTFERRIDLGPSGLVSLLVRRLETAELAPELRRSLSETTVIDPDTAETLLGEVSEARRFLLSEPGPAWGLHDVERQKDVLRIAPLDQPVTLVAIDEARFFVDTESGPQLVLPGQDAAETIGWVLHLNDPTGSMYAQFRDGTISRIPDRVADDLQRLAPGSATVTLRPTSVGLAHARHIVGLREALDAAIDQDTFCVLARAEQPYMPGDTDA